MNGNWKTLTTAPGLLQAEILKGLLEAQDIPVELAHEAVGTVYGLTVGPLGEVQLLVQSQNWERANQVLDEYYSGALEELEQSDEDLEH